jgi:glycine cleavage system H protein
MVLTRRRRSACLPPRARHRLEIVLSSPTDLKYTSSHEWVRDNGDGTLTVGITDHAQDALGELVYVELPQTGRQVTAGEACVVVESTKAASDVYAPVAGEIVAVNDGLADAPQQVNEAPFEKGWLFRLKPQDPAATGSLMSAVDYDRSAAA